MLLVPVWHGISTRYDMGHSLKLNYQIILLEGIAKPAIGTFQKPRLPPAKSAYWQEPDKSAYAGLGQLLTLAV